MQMQKRIHRDTWSTWNFLICNALSLCVCAGGWSAYKIRKTRYNWDKTLQGLKSLSIIKIKLYHCTRLRVVMINSIVKSTWIIISQSMDTIWIEKKYHSSKHILQNANQTDYCRCFNCIYSGIYLCIFKYLIAQL